MTLHLQELIGEHWSDDPADTAAAVMKAPGVVKEWRTLFFPLVRDECRRRAREVARQIEQTPAGTEEKTTPSPAASRLGLLETSFYTGSLYVTWGEATIADHEDRIAFQQAFVVGLGRDMALHRQAIADCRAGGVERLDDLGGDWPPT